jgi:hypothetical protein
MFPSTSYTGQNSTFSTEPPLGDSVIHVLNRVGVAFRRDTTIGTNVVLGWDGSWPLSLPERLHDNNLFVGRDAGVDITSGSNNVIVGGYRGPPTLEDAVVLSGADGSTRIRWVAGNLNAIQSIGPTPPPLSEDGTMAMSYDPAANALRVRVRTAGVTQSVSLGGGGGGGGDIDLSAYAWITDIQRGDGNLALGAPRPVDAIAALDDDARTKNNVLVGRAAGSALRTGSGNVIVGGHPGTATMTGKLALSTADDAVGLWWDPDSTGVTRRSPVQTLQPESTDKPSTALPRDWSLMTQYNTSADCLIVNVRKGGADQLRTFRLLDPAWYASAANLSSVNTAVTAATASLAPLVGTASHGAVVLGPYDATPRPTDRGALILSGPQGTPLLRWNATDRSPVHAISTAADNTTSPALTEDSSMCYTFNSATGRLVLHLRGTSLRPALGATAGGTAHLPVATTDDLSGLATNDNVASIQAYATNTATSLAPLVGTASHGAVVLGPYNATPHPTDRGALILSGPQGTPLLRWNPADRSPVHAISTAADNTTSPALSEDSSMCYTFNSATGRLVLHLRGTSLRPALGATAGGTAHLPLATMDDLSGMATDSNLAAIRADITKAQTDIVGIQGSISALPTDGTVTKLQSDLAALKVIVDYDLPTKALETRNSLATLQTHVANVVNTKQATLETNVTALQTAMTNAQSSATTLTGRVDTAVSNLAALKLIVDYDLPTKALETRNSLASLQTRVTNTVETNIAALRTDVTALQSQVQAADLTTLPAYRTATTTQFQTINTNATSLTARVAALETAPAFRAVNTWSPAYGATMTSTSVTEDCVNKFNNYQPTGTAPATDPTPTLLLGLYAEGAEIEIFNGSAFALRVQPAVANTTYAGRVYTMACLLRGIGTKILPGGAAVVKMLRSTSITALTTEAPVACIMGALTT